MQVEFVARRQVRIFGIDYAPGDIINDPNISPRVLNSLISTRRIGQRINGKADLGPNILGGARIEAAAPPPPEQPDELPPPAEPEPSTDAPQTLVDAPQTDSGDNPRRAVYEARRALEAPDLTLRKFLQGLCAEAGMPGYGDIDFLIARLDAKG